MGNVQTTMVCNDGDCFSPTDPVCPGARRRGDPKSENANLHIIAKTKWKMSYTVSKQGVLGVPENTVSVANQPAPYEAFLHAFREVADFLAEVAQVAVQSCASMTG